MGAGVLCVMWPGKSNKIVSGSADKLPAAREFAVALPPASPRGAASKRSNGAPWDTREFTGLSRYDRCPWSVPLTDSTKACELNGFRRIADFGGNSPFM